MRSVQAFEEASLLATYFLLVLELTTVPYENNVCVCVGKQVMCNFIFA